MSQPRSVLEAGVSAGGSRREDIRTARYCSDLRSVVSQGRVYSFRMLGGGGHTMGGLGQGKGSPTESVVGNLSWGIDATLSFHGDVGGERGRNRRETEVRYPIRIASQTSGP